MFTCVWHDEFAVTVGWANGNLSVQSGVRNAAVNQLTTSLLIRRHISLCHISISKNIYILPSYCVIIVWKFLSVLYLMYRPFSSLCLQDLCRLTFFLRLFVPLYAVSLFCSLFLDMNISIHGTFGAVEGGYSSCVEVAWLGEPAHIQFP